MDIFKLKKLGKYVLLEEDLSDACKITFLYIVSECEIEDGKFYFSMSRLARDRTKGRQTLRDHLDELERNKWLKHIESNNQGTLWEKGERFFKVEVKLGYSTENRATAEANSVLSNKSNINNNNYNNKEFKDNNKRELKDKNLKGKRGAAPTPPKITIQAGRKRKKFRDLPVSEWNADCFVDYYRMRYKEAFDEKTPEREGEIKRGLVVSGIEALFKAGESKGIPKNQLFKDFIDWIFEGHWLKGLTSWTLKTRRVHLSFLSFLSEPKPKAKRRPEASGERGDF